MPKRIFIQQTQKGTYCAAGRDFPGVRFLRRTASPGRKGESPGRPERENDFLFPASEEEELISSAPPKEERRKKPGDAAMNRRTLSFKGF